MVLHAVGMVLLVTVLRYSLGLRRSRKCNDDEFEGDNKKTDSFADKEQDGESRNCSDKI